MPSSWSGPIDASAVFLMLVGMSMAVFAVRLVRTPWKAAWDWWAVIAVVLAVGALTYDAAQSLAGYVALVAFVFLVIVPLRFDGAAQRASRAGDDRKALIFSAIARIFHPLGVVGHRRRSFLAYEKIAAGAPLDDAMLSALGAKGDPLLEELHRLNALHFTGRWREIREALALPARRHRMMRLGFGIVWVRTVARTGGSAEIVDAVREAETWDPTLIDPDRRTLVAFEACSALGDVEGVKAMLPAVARRSPKGVAEAGLAWAQHLANDDDSARATIDAALRRDDLHARGRRALEQARAALGTPSSSRSPEAEALVARMRAEAAAAEALAPLRGMRSARAPIVTWAIVFACTIMWFFLERSAPNGSTDEQHLKDWGALTIPLNGEWWRLFTATLLHSGALHLVFNMIALVIFGRFVEAFYGKLRFALVYLFATLASGLLVVALAHVEPGKVEILVGASGAIMGLGGAACAAVAMRKDLRSSRRGRDELKTFAMIFGAQIVMDNLIPAVSGTAHLGGLFGGALAGALLVPRKK